MDRPYRHFTLEERRTLFRLLNAKLPIEGDRRPARPPPLDHLPRDRPQRVPRGEAVSRVLTRSPPRTAPGAVAAGSASSSATHTLRGHVVEKLSSWWSPEQIAGRLKIAGEDSRLCHETIYQFVYSPEGRALELHRHLLRARRLRRRRFGRKPRSLKIPLERTIAQRPAEIGERQEIGHWEADLLIFRRAHGKANVTSLVERRSRLVRLIPNRDRRSRHVIGAIGEVLASLPATARQTITFDRGSEFLGYAELTRSHGIDAYFCDPHSPWQKGSVENTNGRLRRFLPGELDLATITPAHLQRDRAPDERHAPQVPRLQDPARGVRCRPRLTEAALTPVALRLEPAAQS